MIYSVLNFLDLQRAWFDIFLFFIPTDYDLITPVKTGLDTIHIPAFEEFLQFKLNREQPAIYDQNLLIKTIGKDGKTKISPPSQGCFYSGVDPTNANSLSLDMCGQTVSAFINCFSGVPKGWRRK